MSLPAAGLSAERTALAWRRTAVAAMVVAALFLNHTVTSGWRPEAIASLAAAITLAVAAGLCFARNRSLHNGHYGHSQTVVTATVVAVVAVAGIAAALGFTDPLL